ncbi:hypothetical protein A9G24_04715 [Gilliamella sp. App6-5]|nr:hypothetical protein A9G24_04715 [Gilliamella apicola]
MGDDTTNINDKKCEEVNIYDNRFYLFRIKYGHNVNINMLTLNFIKFQQYKSNKHEYDTK